MRTMHLDVTPMRFVLTKTLGQLTHAAHFWPTAPLHLSEMPDPPLPGPSWVRVRNRICAICGSDLHQLYLDASLDVAPTALPTHNRIYLGHERVGEVTEIGDQVNGLRLGDRVVRWGRADDCRARGLNELCPACQRGHRVLCPVGRLGIPKDVAGLVAYLASGEASFVTGQAINMTGGRELSGAVMPL